MIITGARVTWRRRVGVLTVAWYASPSPQMMPRTIFMVHLPLTGSAS